MAHCRHLDASLVFTGCIQSDMRTECRIKMADFVGINKISTELCLHASSSLMSKYLLLFEH